MQYFLQLVLHKILHSIRYLTSTTLHEIQLLQSNSRNKHFETEVKLNSVLFFFFAFQVLWIFGLCVELDRSDAGWKKYLLYNLTDWIQPQNSLLFLPISRECPFKKVSLNHMPLYRSVIVHLQKISFLPIVAQITRQTLFSMLDLSTTTFFTSRKRRCGLTFTKTVKISDSNMHKNGADVSAN